ncbi:MAG: 6-phosphofructokinase, partial [Acidimicrobiia bacterium]
MRIGILTGGGDVPGLNACIKAVVNRVSREGHEVVGIRRGWAGLAFTDPADRDTSEKNLVPLDPGLVRTVDRTGGTFLHTSRTNPARVSTGDLPDFLKRQVDGDGPHDITRHVLQVLSKHKIDVLIPIGGDDTLSY